MLKNILTAGAIGAAALAAPASAATFIVDTVTNTPLVGKAYATFNNRTLGNTTQTTGTGLTVSFTGAGAFVQGNSGTYVTPIVSNGNGALFGGQADGPDATVYLTTGIGSATIALAIPSTYFGLLWGSIDPYNSITFNTADGMSTTFTGAQIIGNLQSVSRYVNFTSTSAITSVVMSSSGNAFEFDNVAVNAAIPEPATWALMLAGFGAVGFAMRRRQAKGVRGSYAA